MTNAELSTLVGCAAVGILVCQRNETCLLRKLASYNSPFFPRLRSALSLVSIPRWLMPFDSWYNGLSLSLSSTFEVSSPFDLESLSKELECVLLPLPSQVNQTRRQAPGWAERWIYFLPSHLRHSISAFLLLLDPQYASNENAWRNWTPRCCMAFSCIRNRGWIRFIISISRIRLSIQLGLDIFYIGW